MIKEIHCKDIEGKNQLGHFSPMLCIKGLKLFEDSDLEQTKILCKMCHTTMSAPQGNKTNLFNHLKSTHRVTHDQEVKEQKN